MPRTKRPETLSEVAKKFCTLSTVRGVPRIVRSQNIFWSFAWLAIVLIFFSFAMYFVVMILSEYFTFPVIRNEVFDSENFQYRFPAVTICDSRDQAISTTNISSKLSYEKFVKKVNLCLTKINLEPIELREFRDYILRGGFYRYLGHEGAKFVGRSEEFFVDCIGVYHGQTTRKSRHCAKAKRFAHPVYYNCYTVTIPDIPDMKRYFVKDLDAIFYLNDAKVGDKTSKTGFEMFSNNDERTAEGVRVTIHPQGTRPDVDHMGLNLMAGTHTTLNLNTFVWERQPYPYSNCHTEAIPPMVDVNGYSFNMTYDLCSEICLQKSIIKRCGCKTSDLPETKEMSMTPYCADIEKDIHDLIQKFRCLKNTIEHSEMTENCPCHGPCIHEAYQTTSTSTAWPPEYYLIDFYRTIIKNSSFADEFKIYENISKMVDSDINGAINELEKHQMIEKSFLRVTINQLDAHSRHFIDSPKFRIETIFGSIGGALSLWVGMSLMTLMELIELIHDIIVVMIKKVFKSEFDKNRKHERVSIKLENRFLTDNFD